MPFDISAVGSDFVEFRLLSSCLNGKKYHVHTDLNLAIYTFLIKLFYIITGTSSSTFSNPNLCLLSVQTVAATTARSFSEGLQLSCYSQEGDKSLVIFTQPL